MKCGTKAAIKQQEISEYSIELLALLDMFKGHGAYKHIQSFLASKKIKVSIGSIAKFIKENFQDVVNTDRVEYGSGNQVKVGRASRDKFTCKTNGETYVKLAEKWVRSYVGMMQDMLKEEKDSDVVIHHKDGNHLNNEKSNLKIMSRGEHTSLHQKKFWADKKQEINKKKEIKKEVK